MHNIQSRGSVRMNPLSLLSAAFFLISTPLAANAQQVLDSSKLPTCAFKCGKLTQAQDACVPPAAPVTDQGTYQSCYCQSAYLVTLYSTPSGLCDDVCSPSDAQKIQDWYEGLCHDGIVVTPTGSSPTQSTTTSGSSSSSSTASGSPSSTAGSNPQTSSSRKSPPGSWISSHYGWVIFLIVLGLFLIVGLWLGLWLRRRQKRKADTRRFSSNSHLPGPASAASPYGSGVLSHADASYMGSRNHPQMTMVPDAGSEAAFERYGGYGGAGGGGATPGSRGGERDGMVASPAPAKGARGLVKAKRTYS